MATIVSIPTSVTILAPGSSVLSTVVASMAPGSWAQLSAANQSAILGVGPSSGSMLPYCNAMPWNRVSRCIEIVAGDHGSPTGLRQARYVEATNSFELVAATTGFVGHGYDHTEVNPYTGDIYHRRYGGYNVGPSQVYRQALGSTTWTLLPQVTARNGITCGTCWWSGPFTGGSGLGSQGGFAVYCAAFSNNTANDGQITIFDPLSNSWKLQATGVAPFQPDGYHESAAYSAAKNVAVYGGTNPSPRKIWKMVSTGATSALTDVPAAAAGVGIHKGLLVEDPVTGNFLLVTNNSGSPALYELNPDGGGTWTLQTGSRVPPAGVGYPANAGPTACLFATALPDHGVIAVIRQTNPANGAFWLYRHA